MVQHRKGQDNANADALSRLNSMPHFVPEREGGNIKDRYNRGDWIVVLVCIKTVIMCPTIMAMCM